jgi:hypothetical protein
VSDERDDERYPHDAKRREAEAEQFRSADDDAASGENTIHKSGRLRGDRDPDRDPALRRRKPMIPGVHVSKSGKARTHFPPRGTAGWKRGKGEIHPRHRKYRVHSAKGGRVPGDVEPWLVDVHFREDRDAWAMATAARLLGEERVARLVAVFQRGPGQPSRAVKADRVYLGMVLAGWGPWADAPVARLLSASERRITDLRRARQAGRDGAKGSDLAAAARELRQRAQALPKS